MTHRFAPSAAMLLALLLPITAAAQESDQESADAPSAQAPSEDPLARSKEIYANGTELYEEGNYKLAAVAFEEAYALSDRKILLFNISNAWERAGDLNKAIDYLNQYRVYAPAEERPKLERRLAVLEKRLAEAAPAQAAPAVAAPAEAAPAETDTPSEPVAPPPVEGASAKSSGHGLAYATMGVGVASALTGALFAVRASDTRKSLESSCQTVDDKLICPSDVQEELQQNRVNTWVAEGAFAFGGAAILGGAALAIFTDVPVQPTLNGLMFHGQF